jgi:hypothetical protein
MDPYRKFRFTSTGTVRVPVTGLHKEVPVLSPTRGSVVSASVRILMCTVVLLWAAPGVRAELCREAPCPKGPPIFKVGLGESIQAAIEAAPSGSTILVAPGVFEGPLTVSGKAVKLIGDGPTSSEIVVTDPLVANVTIGADGAAELLNFKLTGGRAGIEGQTGAGGVRATALMISRGTWGVLGSFSSFRLTDTTISDTFWHGIYLVDLGDSWLSTIRVERVGGVGIYINNTGSPAVSSDSCVPHLLTQQETKTIRLTEAEVLFAPLGGIVIVGGAKPVCIEQTFLQSNGAVGIHLIQSDFAEIKDSHIDDTRALPDGALGDAIVIDLSRHVVVRGSEPPGLLGLEAQMLLSNSARVGLTNFGSYVELGNTQFECNVIDLDLEAEPANFYGPGIPPEDTPGTFINLQGNVCGCAGDVSACRAQSTQIVPPAPPPVPPPAQ